MSNEATPEFTFPATGGLKTIRLVDSQEPCMSLKLAFASTDGQVVDEHFGAAPRFQVFTLNETGAHRSAVVVCNTGEGHDDKRLSERIAALRDCRAVFCTAIGQGALRQLRASGLEAIRVAENQDISQLIADWQSGRIGIAPKAADDVKRFDQYLDEGWSS